MIVAIIDNEKVISINDYPDISNIDDIRNDFIYNYTFVDITDKEIPEYESFSNLRYIDGEIVYYESESTDSEPTQLDLIEQKQAEQDVVQAEIMLNQMHIMVKQNEISESLNKLLQNESV